MHSTRARAGWMRALPLKFAQVAIEGERGGKVGDVICSSLLHRRYNSSFRWVGPTSAGWGGRFF